VSRIVLEVGEMVGGPTSFGDLMGSFIVLVWRTVVVIGSRPSQV